MDVQIDWLFAELYWPHAERIARIYLALANALMQVEGYRSQNLNQALEAARLVAANSDSVKLQCEVSLSQCSYLFATGQNSIHIKLASQQNRESRRSVVSCLPERSMGY
jgi:hypothetical protein